MRAQTQTEEQWNVITHAIGFLASILGLFLLLRKFSESTTITVVAITIYGFSLMCLYLISTLYHNAKKELPKRRLRILDHISIYLLIAGTYTPVVLIALPDSYGWQLFYAVWGIAAIGLLLKVFFTGKFETISLLLYLVMGWLIVLDFTALKTVMPEEGVHLLMLGGAFYTGGIVFYVWNKLKYNHVIWHLFVMAGSASHFFMIYKYV